MDGPSKALITNRLEREWGMTVEEIADVFGPAVIRPLSELIHDGLVVIVRPGDRHRPAKWGVPGGNCHKPEGYRAVKRGWSDVTLVCYVTSQGHARRGTLIVDEFLEAVERGRALNRARPYTAYGRRVPECACDCMARHLLREENARLRSQLRRALADLDVLVYGAAGVSVRSPWAGRKRPRVTA